MRFWTYKEIKEKVLRDLDMEGETFVTPAELLGYANEAIDEVERQIHTLYEDYFVARSTIDLVAGQEEYSIPDNIYGLKIRQIIFRQGNEIWNLHRLKNWHKFSIYEQEKANTTATKNYGYFILNQSAGNPKIIITPTPNQIGTLQIWYIRNASELVNDSSVCDIPEAVNYVMAFMKMRCMEKEFHPNLQKAITDVEQQKADTLMTLNEMYADNSNEIEPDFRLYNDMTGGE